MVCETRGAPFAGGGADVGIGEGTDEGKVVRSLRIFAAAPVARIFPLNTVLGACPPLVGTRNSSRPLVRLQTIYPPERS